MFVHVYCISLSDSGGTYIGDCVCVHVCMWVCYCMITAFHYLPMIPIQDGMTAAMWAAMGDHTHTIVVLARMGANIDIQDWVSCRSTAVVCIAACQYLLQ